MARRTLVDGFNLIHAAPGLQRVAEERGLPEAVRSLIATLTRWVRLERREVILVCDGVRPQGLPLGQPAPGLQVRFADDADLALLELLGRRGSHLLVSADGELVRAARNVGADVAAPRGWFERVIDGLGGAGLASAKERQPTATEVAEWLEVFEGPRPASPRAPSAEGLPPEAVKEWLEYFGEGE